MRIDLGQASNSSLTLLISNNVDALEMVEL